MSIRESGDALAAYQLDSSLQLVQSLLTNTPRSKKVFRDDEGRAVILERDQTVFDPFYPCFEPTVQMASYVQRVEMTGTPNFGGVSEFVIPPMGDFLSNLVVCITLPELKPQDGFYADWTSSIAYVLCQKIDLYFGNTLFDTLEGDWLEILDEIDLPDRQYNANCQMVGRYASPYLVTSQSADEPVQDGDRTFYCRLRFSFTDAVNMSLPLLSLPFTQIRIRITWRPFDECITYDGIIPPLYQPIRETWINATYTKLDTAYSLPVYNYADAKLAYLHRTMRYVEQIIPAGAINTQLSLSEIKVPCSGLVFVLRDLNSEANNDWFNFSLSDGSASPILSSARLTVDGYERYPKQDETFYRLEIPSTYVKRSPRNCVYIMPFSQSLLEVNKSSGTLDFEKIKNPTLWLTLNGLQTATRLKVFALTYNIMGIRKGQIILRS